MASIKIAHVGAGAGAAAAAAGAGSGVQQNDIILQVEVYND
jgi:hypothetical protein